MDFGTVLSVAQTLFAALQSKELQEVCSVLGYRSQLEDLQRTVSTVKAVLLDAETKEVLSHEAQLWIQELKNAVYDADDLLDEFVTVAQQKQFLKGGTTSKTVRSFFSRYNPLGVAYNMSQRVKKIRKNLNAVAKNHAQFGFSIDPQPIRLRREETCSYVHERNIIGREDDIENIVGHLLNDSNKRVSFLTIVGIGGLGKTTLAQLVYNDARVTSAFPLKIWTCVSDHDQQQLCVDQILRKILNSKDDGSTLELLQSQVRAKLTKNKYLLVLDDVWTENRNHWLKLEEFLLGGKQGSWIVLTTRSHKTASIIGDGPITYELQGLSEENSWCLFQKIAFGSKEPNPHGELVEIGHEIVQGCSRVPLALRVAGSLLYGQDKSIWISFRKIGLSNFRESQLDIMPILKLSYHQLESPLKSCFTYCALFPKDTEIDVCLLQGLWMAQGYIVPLDDGQSLEDAAKEYFSILLRRCFFQDVKYGIMGYSCKMHDLMHDVAKKIMGEEICVADSDTNNVHKKARHLVCSSGELTQVCFKETALRSCLYPEFPKSASCKKYLKAMLLNWKSLRVLVLGNLDVKCLPDSIGEMLHLRLLVVSENPNLEMLPKSFINLHNLQALKLDGCKNLKELPKDFEKLVNLRRLDIESCGIKYLTCLGSLPHLMYLRLVHLDELEYINENGELQVRMSALTAADGRLNAEGYLSFPCLEMLQLRALPKLKAWGNKLRPRVEVIDSDIMMTPLLLPQLKSMTMWICGYIRCNLLLPKVEVLEIASWHEIGQMHINRLSKEAAGDVNTEENTTTTTTTTSSSSCCCYGVPRLRKVECLGNGAVAWLNRIPVESFECLESLSIMEDEEMESLREVGEVFRSCSSSLVSLDISCCTNLRSVMSGGFEYLSALQTLQIRISSEEEEDWKSWLPFQQTLRRLSLTGLCRVENLPDWIQFLSALETLEVYGCFSLKTMPDWMPKLTSLKQLQLKNCSNDLKNRCRGEDWPLIQHIPSIHISVRQIPVYRDKVWEYDILKVNIRDGKWDQFVLST